MRCILLCIGSLKSSWCSDGCADYLSRLKHLVALEVVELPASKENNADRQRDNESQRLLEAIAKRDGVTWVLDERGKGMTSAQFSKEVAAIADSGTPLLFVLGGAYGLTDAVRQRADRVLSLSSMTFPHELCRIVFLEQLYRAMQIRQGSGYHH